MTHFANTRVLLEQVLKGSPVGEILLNSARQELNRAEPLLELNLMRQQHTASLAPPTTEELLGAARDTFMMLERLLIQGRADGYFDSLDTLDADRMLQVRSLLQKAGCAPFTTRRNEPLVYRRKPARP